MVLTAIMFQSDAAFCDQPADTSASAATAALQTDCFLIVAPLHDHAVAQRHSATENARAQSRAAQKSLRFFSLRKWLKRERARLSLNSRSSFSMRLHGASLLALPPWNHYAARRE